MIISAIIVTQYYTTLDLIRVIASNDVCNGEGLVEQMLLIIE